MAFNSITIGPNTFNAVGNGSYMLSTVTFGQPQNLLKIAPGAQNAKTGITTCAISRHAEVDFPVPTGGNERRKASVILQVQAPIGFTSVTLDAIIQEISDFVTSGNLDRILMGES